VSFVAGAAVALAGVALWTHGGSASAPAAPASTAAGFTLDGTISLPFGGFSDPANGITPVIGDDCAGDSGYSDISEGVAVTIGDQSGATLIVGQLQAGQVQGGPDALDMVCQFVFNVPVPGDESLYTVTISHRGTQTFTAVEAEGGVALTLGDS
jgi:hypothetical protein